jgi:probable addiction module antidote protein
MTAKLKSESYAPLDIAELLETDQQIADFLKMLLAEGSPKEIAAGLGTVARSRGMTNVAREAGMSR